MIYFGWIDRRAFLLVCDTPYTKHFFVILAKNKEAQEQKVDAWFLTRSSEQKMDHRAGRGPLMSHAIFGWR